MFREDLRLLDGDVGAWKQVYDAIRSAVVLRYPDGRDVPEFLLHIGGDQHIDGDQAWWRWSATPFDKAT